MAIVREVAAEIGVTPEFEIVGMRDDGVAYLKPDEAEIFAVNTLSLLNPWGSWAALGRSDIVLDIGAGDSFAEIYGLKRFLFLWATKVIALAWRRPLLLSPQTIGPFTRTPYRQLARVVLERARGVVVRDRESLSALEALAPKARATLSVDVALRLPYDDRSHERGGERIRVGVNVSGLLFSEAERGTNHFGLSANYARFTTRFIDELVKRPDVEVHLVPHVIADDDHPDNDSRLANRLHRQFPQTVRAPDFVGPCEAKSYISSLDFLVGARMHACIAAYSSGVPVVPVAYSRKFSGLFGLLEYDWLVPVKGMSDDEALAFTLDCLEKRDKLAAGASRGMDTVAELLRPYRAELATLMSEWLSRQA
ncbi:MAG: polysaccharide pyruvyl transferase family protein [Phenylobacterium sp.]